MSWKVLQVIDWHPSTILLSANLEGIAGGDILWVLGTSHWSPAAHKSHLSAGETHFYQKASILCARLTARQPRCSAWRPAAQTARHTGRWCTNKWQDPAYTGQHDILRKSYLWLFIHFPTLVQEHGSNYFQNKLPSLQGTTQLGFRQQNYWVIYLFLCCSNNFANDAI